MTIFSFADTRFPIERANGVQTMHTCHALVERGHDVTLLTRPDTAAPARDPFAFYGLAPQAGFSIVTAAGAGPEPLKRTRLLWAAMRRALTGSFDVVFTRDLGLAALLTRVPRARRPALVYESHGIAAVVAEERPALLGPAHGRPAATKLRRLDGRDARVWRLAEGYVTLTRALAEDLAGRYGPRAEVSVVPDGAVPATVPATTGGAPVIAAYAGHLYPWKGVDVFVEALALAPTLHGLIVGGHRGEPDLERIEALLARHGLAARVVITGLLPPQEVARHLARADIFVLPNTRSAISERYTSPLKLFEYLTLGRAIVASDLPALREVLTDDETAMLVPPGDAAALARALTRLADDPVTRQRLGAGAARLAPDYSWSRRAERLEAVCRKAAAS